MFSGIIDRLNDICIVAGKELRHCFRDSHVLIYTVFVPLILYPVSLVSLSEYSLWREGLAETRPIHVAFEKDGLDKIPEFLAAVKEAKRLKVVESDNPTGDLQQGKLECVVDGSNAPESIKIILNQASDRFLETKVAMATKTFEARGKAMRKALEDAGCETKVIRVFDIVTTSVGTIGGRKAKLQDMELTAFSTTMVLVAFYGYTMLIITVGAVYPALASFTEEFEKRTKNTTYMLPVERSSVVIGKFSAVVLLTLLSGMVNFFSMGLVAVCFTWKLDWLRRTLALALKQYSLGNVILLLVVFLLSTLLVAAIYSLMAANAKSFKEAQNASSLILIGITILPMVALLPGWQLNELTALVPILNMVLAAKAIVTDSLGSFEMICACVETIAVTSVLVYLSQVVFWGREPADRVPEDKLITNPSTGEG